MVDCISSERTVPSTVTEDIHENGNGGESQRSRSLQQKLWTTLENDDTDDGDDISHALQWVFVFRFSIGNENNYLVITAVFAFDTTRASMYTPKLQTKNTHNKTLCTKKKATFLAARFPYH